MFIHQKYAITSKAAHLPRILVAVQMNNWKRVCNISTSIPAIFEFFVCQSRALVPALCHLKTHHYRPYVCFAVILHAKLNRHEEDVGRIVHGGTCDDNLIAVPVSLRQSSHDLTLQGLPLVEMSIT
ncbi:unnamed protein product [Caenorhabditis brenneri]